MKSRKSLFLKTMALIAIIFFLNMSFFVFKFGEFSGGISGFLISDVGSKISSTYDKIPLASKLFFLSAWLVFLSLIIGVFVRDKILSERKNKELHLNLNYGKFQTDLDVLYEVLKQKQKLRIKSISKAFKVKPEQAMDWAKILETGKLATIEYPGLFGDPELVIIKN